MEPARHVSSTDGVRLAVYETGHGTGHETGHETGPADAPVLVAVHGYPDNHTVWDGVTAHLADRFRVVRYDVRGAGASDRPARRAAYRMDRLVDDLATVVDAASPGVPVHLLGHDWGSIQCWAAITDERLAGRVASFTSISGPSLDQAVAWLRAGHRHPRAFARQLLESWYLFAFQLPRLPEAVLRTGLSDRVLAGPPREQADKLAGLQLYRANLLGGLSRPRPGRTDVPVQVLAPRGDPFVSVPLQTQAPVPYVAHLSTRVLSGGHWVLADRPDVVARLAAEHVDRVLAGLPEPAPRPRAGSFADRLVVVTGGGRGIGRACALEFAREGADVLVADIDDAAAKRTAEQVEALGVRAVPYHLDVSDAAAWEAFAERVRAEHGVPDVVVNNAGIGMGGPVLQTTVAAWARVLGVNLWGVIHGSRLFGRQMVERGEGGQLVNVASAAAFAPSRTLPAYSTSKAAVLMLTECLRAELAREGIGVTAICPGFVDSDITRTTTFVGTSDEEQEQLREHAAASYRRRNYTPERLARHAVRAAAHNTPVAAISVESKALRALGRFAPALGRRVGRVDLSRL